MKDNDKFTESEFQKLKKKYQSILDKLGTNLAIILKAIEHLENRKTQDRNNTNDKLEYFRILLMYSNL